MHNTTEAENIFPYSIPESWQWTTLEKVCDFERGITFPATAKKSNATEKNIPCTRTANVQEKLDISDLIYVDKSYTKNNSAKLLKVGDIIMSSANSKELVGKTCYVSNVPFEMTFGGFVLVIRTENISKKYLFYFLRCEFLFGKFIDKSTQTVNIANINTKKLANYKIPLPPLNEQKRIVARLESLFSKLDAAKEKVQTVLDGYELRRSAILHKAFTGELSKKFRAENNLSLDDWQTKKLGNLLTKIQYGYTAKAEKNNSLPKMLRITDIQNGFVNWETVPNCKIDDNQKEKYLLKDNDIVIARTGATTGKSYILKNSPISVFASYLVRLQTSEQIKSEFLYQFLQSDFYWNQISDFSSGIAQPGVNATKLKNILIPLPPLAEQKEIVRVLDSLLVKEQRTKEIAENILQEIDLLKKSILARAFRGEL